VIPEPQTPDRIEPDLRQALIARYRGRQDQLRGVLANVEAYLALKEMAGVGG
jgi:hypothetical protein